ncbi:arginine:ornithine antiporter [Brenneria populi]|uniref:Arginine:ornithine antiporter n=1 Tax=Brenneria populi TaxID=1505588 RepID=A0ABU6JUI4_9GAMM|nr:arginine:ornithine antiporter [Brenneria populi Li et al. 2015]
MGRGKAASIFYFWGTLDLFYAIRFLWLNLAHNRVPIYDDIHAFLSYRPISGVYGDILFALSLCLTLSIPVSAWLFLWRASCPSPSAPSQATLKNAPGVFLSQRLRRSAVALAYLQTPVRLLTMTPSLSFIPWFIGMSGLQHAPLNLGLLLFSEIAKVTTLRFARAYGEEKRRSR